MVHTSSTGALDLNSDLPVPIHLGTGTCSRGARPYPALPRILGQAWCSLGPSRSKRLQWRGSRESVQSSLPNLPNSQCLRRARSFRKAVRHSYGKSCRKAFSHSRDSLSFFDSLSHSLFSSLTGLPFSFIFLYSDQASLLALGGWSIRHWPNLCAPVSEYIS